MRLSIHSFPVTRAQTPQAIPKGWYWMAALVLSLGLWWALFKSVGFLLSLV